MQSRHELKEYITNTNGSVAELEEYITHVNGSSAELMHACADAIQTVCNSSKILKTQIGCLFIQVDQSSLVRVTK
jgi:hypothetical protein